VLYTGSKVIDRWGHRTLVYGPTARSSLHPEAAVCTCGREEAYVSSTPRDTMPILSRVVFFTIYIISSA
jgi:hypothetical protein